MPYLPTPWKSGTTPLDAPELNNLESAYRSAMSAFNADLLAPFVLSGLVPTKDGSVATQLDVTSGVAYLAQPNVTVASGPGTSTSSVSQNDLARISVGATTWSTSVASTTYYLDLQPDGTYSWGTAHSTQANYLTICTVTTDASANIASVTDSRTLAPRLLPGAVGTPVLPGVQTTAPSTLDNGLIATDGLGTTAATAPAAPAAPTAASASSGSPSATYKAAVLADAPLRYYRMDAPSGTTETDLGSQAQNATTHGAPTQNVTGLLNGDTDTAYTFTSASGQYLSAASTGLPTGAAAWSIEAWVKLTAYPSAYATVASFGATTASTLAWLLINTNGTAQLSTNGGPTVTSAALSLNTPHHLVATYSGGTITLYVDGASVGTASGTLNLASGSSLYIGAYVAVNDYFNGTLDEVAIYGTALSGARIVVHYATATDGPDYATLPGVGSYSYGYTFVSALAESALSPRASVTTTAGNQKVALSGIAPGPSGTTRRKLYRTPLGGSGTPQLVSTLADNTTTTYTDATPDGGLGTAVATHPSAGGDIWRNAGGQTVAQIAGDGALAVIGGQVSAGSFGAPVIVAQVINQNITSTAGTIVLTFTPPANGIYMAVGAFTYSNTAASSVTFNVGFNDPNAGRPGIPFSSGPTSFMTYALGGGTTTYTTNPITFYAQAGQPITIKFTDSAGTPNDYVSAMLLRLT